MAQVVVEMTGNEARLWRAYQKIIQQETKLREGMEKTAKVSRKTAAEAQDVGNKIQKSFGSQALNSLQGYATGFLSLEAGVQLVSAALHHMKGESDAALQSLKSLTDHNRRLNQVARDSADLAGLQNRADIMAAQSGLDRQVVRQLLFSGRSEGFEEYTERIVQLSQVIDPTAAATVAGQVPALFPNQNVTSEEAMEMTFVGARESRSTFEDVAKNLPKVAEGANLAGASAAETIALSTVLDKRFASGETSADRLKAFATKIGTDERLQGKGVIGAMRELQSWSSKDRRKFLGDSQEANVTYAILEQELPKVVERLQQIESARQQAGTAGSSLNTALARAAADPNFKAAKTIAQAEVRREIARERRLGTGRADVVAAGENLMADLDDIGASGFSKYTAETVSGAVQLSGASANTTQAAGAIASDAPGAGLAYMAGNALNPALGAFSALSYLMGGFGNDTNRAALGRVNQGSTDPLTDAAKDLKQAAKDLKSTTERKPAVEQGE